MKFARKVMIAVSLEDNTAEILKPLRSMEFLNHSEVHFVHIFSTINYTGFFGEFPLIYPVEADRSSIEQSILALLRKLGKESMPAGFEGKIIERCLFSESPKSRFADYVNEGHADLVIIPTRKERGIFETSFASYVNKHTQADLLLLK